MVSTINILKSYYQIPLNDQMFFSYQGKNYYLSCNVNESNYYPTYLMLVKLKGFKVVENIYHQYVSQNHILYKYYSFSIDINQYCQSSLVTIKKGSVNQIKRSWIKLLDDVKHSYLESDYQSTYFNIYFYYYYYLGFVAIELMNHYFKESDFIDIGFQHNIVDFESKVYMNPDNIKISTVGEDLIMLYLFNQISINELDKCLKSHHLSHKQYAMLLCKIFYPSYFYQDLLVGKYQKKKQYRYLTLQHDNIKIFYKYIKKYIDVPSIYWI